MAVVQHDMASADYAMAGGLDVYDLKCIALGIMAFRLGMHWRLQRLLRRQKKASRSIEM